MGQQVASQPDLVLEGNDFILIFPSFLEMIWLTVRRGGNRSPCLLIQNQFHALPSYLWQCFCWVSKVFSQPLETGQTRKAPRSTDGKSASVSVWKAGSSPTLPTNSPPLRFSVMTSGQSGAFCARQSQRNKAFRNNWEAGSVKSPLQGKINVFWRCVSCAMSAG